MKTLIWLLMKRWWSRSLQKSEEYCGGRTHLSEKIRKRINIMEFYKIRKIRIKILDRKITLKYIISWKVTGIVLNERKQRLRAKVNKISWCED